MVVIKIDGAEFIKKQIKKEFTAPKTKVTEGHDTAEASAKGLIAEIDRYLTSNSGDGYKQVTGFHPSYTNECKRYWYLLFEGVETEAKTSGRGQRIFHVGTMMHERWQGYLKEMGILVGAEVPVVTDDPVPIRGTADAIIEWGGKKVIELKSINPDGFQLRSVYKKPKEEHYAQIQLYMYCLKIDKGFVIYENKGTQDVLVFPVELDEEYLKKAFTKKKKIWDLFQEGKRPERPYKRTSKNCTWCELEKTCWDVLED